MKKTINSATGTYPHYRMLMIMACLISLFICSSCVPTRPPQDVVIRANITASPTDVQVVVNGQHLGTAPTSYMFNFTAQPMYTLSFSKNDYLPLTLEITEQTLLATGGSIHGILSLHPLVSATSLQYPANSWITLNLIADVLEKSTWNRLVGRIKTKYPTIQRANGNNGSILTGFRQQSYSLPVGTVLLRSRIKTKFIKEFPVLRMGFYLQTEVSYDGIVWEKYHRTVKRDVQLLNSIKNQFGLR